jgi:hypothetical protein
MVLSEAIDLFQCAELKSPSKASRGAAFPSPGSLSQKYSPDCTWTCLAGTDEPMLNDLAECAAPIAVRTFHAHGDDHVTGCSGWVGWPSLLPKLRPMRHRLLCMAVPETLAGITAGEPFGLGDACNDLPELVRSEEQQEQEGNDEADHASSTVESDGTGCSPANLEGSTRGALHVAHHGASRGDGNSRRLLLPP